MTRKDWIIVAAILVAMAVLIFFGYKDYLRQQQLKQPAQSQSISGQVPYSTEHV